MINFVYIVIAIVSGIATYFVSNILERGAVLGSATVVLAAGLLLPHFFPTHGANMAALAACSSYAGMISVENALDFVEMTIISTMAAILFIVAENAYLGIGGRLGTIAAISCFAWLGFKKIFVGIDQEKDSGQEEG